MSKYLEWDIDNPAHRRRHRRPPPIDGEVLEPEPAPRIHRVEVTVHHRRRHQAPAWIIPLAIIAVLSMVTPYGLIVAIVMGAVLVTAHPVVGIALGVTVAALVIVAIHERYRGRPF